MHAQSPRSFRTGIKRGICRYCPNCGKGPLFDGYIKVHSPCAACGNDNGAYRADDAPAWLTILIVGHAVIAPILYFGLAFILTVSLGLVLALLLPFIFLVTLLILPFAKGTIIGMEWARAKPAAHHRSI